jgi:hypothetical protein
MTTARDWYRDRPKALAERAIIRIVVKKLRPGTPAPIVLRVETSLSALLRQQTIAGSQRHAERASWDYVETSA